MDVIPPITGDLSASLPIKIILCACIAGAANKIYDDIEDNFRFDHFKTPHNAEMLKGIHYIMCTILGIAHPLFFIILYFATFINKFITPSSYVMPYESSLLYSFATLFLFLDYSKIDTLYADEKKFIIFGTLGVAIEEIVDYISKKIYKNSPDTILLTKEVSSQKLWMRLICMASLIFWNFKCKISPSIQCFVFYIFAYLAVSCCTQFYSLYIYKPPQPIEVPPIIKEKKEETEETLEQPEIKEDTEPPIITSVSQV
jgi:hypothetical protein